MINLWQSRIEISNLVDRGWSLHLAELGEIIFKVNLFNGPAFHTCIINWIGTKTHCYLGFLDNIISQRTLPHHVYDYAKLSDYHSYFKSILIYYFPFSARLSAVGLGLGLGAFFSKGLAHTWSYSRSRNYLNKFKWNWITILKASIFLFRQIYTLPLH